MNRNIITLPDNLANSLRDHLVKSSFATLDDLVLYILQEYLDHFDQEEDDLQPDPEKDREVEERLKNLGYL